jgi:hypothetical protein
LAIIQLRIAQDSPIPRPDKIKKMEEIFKKITADKERYGFYNAVLAAQRIHRSDVDDRATARLAQLAVGFVDRGERVVEPQVLAVDGPLPDRLALLCAVNNASHIRDVIRRGIYPLKMRVRLLADNQRQSRLSAAWRSVQYKRGDLISFY